MTILGLIPARGGSKGIPHKNIVPLAGKPLIAHTILAAQGCSQIDRLIVSTDDEQIAAIARQWGAEVPFLRPPHLAEDTTPALPVIQHVLSTLEQNEGWRAEMVVYLQPTSPLRRTEHIEEAIKLCMEQHADTVVSVIPVPHHFNPASVMRLENGQLLPFLPGEAHLLRRQDKPQVFARNGPAVLVMTYATLMEQQTLYGARTLPYLMDEHDSLDIDTLLDLEWAEYLLSRKAKQP